MPSFLTNYSFTLLFSLHLHRKSNVLTFFYFFTYFILLFTYFCFLLTLRRKNCRSLILFKCFHFYFLFRCRFLFLIHLFLSFFFLSVVLPLFAIFFAIPSLSLSLSPQKNQIYTTISRSILLVPSLLACFLPSWQHWWEVIKPNTRPFLPCFLPSWQRWWELIKPHIMAAVCLPTNRCRSLPHVSDTCFSPR